MIIMGFEKEVSLINQQEIKHTDAKQFIARACVFTGTGNTLLN